MKKLSTVLIAFFAITSTIAAQVTEVVRLSEPVQVTENYEVFGAKVQEWEEALPLSDVIITLEKLEGQALQADLSLKPITIKAEVAEVCTKKGCFFIAKSGEFEARVTFKDYSFFIPTDSQGKTVKLVGVLGVKELSEEQAKHYAEDAGKDTEMITGSQKEYSFVATSVLVPES